MAFDRADLVFAIQEKEREVFSRMTRTPVVTLSHMTPLNFLDGKLAIPGRMLFVASDNSINVHGIQTFIREALPLIRAQVPSAYLCLAGSICKAVDEHSGVIKLGRVDDLQSAYQHAQVIVNPVLFNTGLSIKNLEALGFGKPLVTATVGTEGMEAGIGTAFEAADSPTDFALRCIGLLVDDSHRTAVTEGSIRYIEQCNRNIASTLADALKRRVTAWNSSRYSGRGLKQSRWLRWYKHSTQRPVLNPKFV